MGRAVGWLCLVVFVQGCYLSHGREEDPGVVPIEDPPPDIVSSGRGLFSNDDDWFKPGLGSGRGDADATALAVQWLEGGLASPRIQICGTHPDMDSVDEGWTAFDGSRTRDVRVRQACAGELRALLADRDIVLIEYVTTAWGSEPEDWTEDDLDAAWEHFVGGGRVAVLEDLGRVRPFFERFGVDPETLDTGDRYGDVAIFDVADRDIVIGQVAFLADPR